MNILSQYRQWRQSNDPNELFQLADRLDLLSGLERHTGTIHPCRQGQVAQQVESHLGNPEKYLTNEIYLQLYATGVQSGCYSHGISDDTLTAYCQLRSKGYWTNYLSPEELEVMRPIDDLEAIYAYPVSGAVKEAIERYIEGEV